MKFMPSFILVVLLFATGLALAADPQIKEPLPTREGTAVPAPDIPVNQAEIQAGVVLDTPAALKSLHDDPALSPMMVEIKAALDASRAQVAELSVRAANAPDHAAQAALHREVAQVKQQVELDILAIQARFARERGDEQLAQRIDEAIEAIQNPPAPEAPTETRPAPLNR